jgi:hypothetical protein
MGKAKTKFRNISKLDKLKTYAFLLFFKIQAPLPK